MTDSCNPRELSRSTHGYTVTYKSVPHFHVLTQSLGSVWPSVIPYCLFNVLLSLVLQLFQGYHGFHFHFSDKGHAYLTMLVAFLVVTRATVTLGRYSQVRASLEQIYCMQRQLIHQMAVVSSENMNESAKEWRHDIAYISLLHLRSMMAVINYETDGIPSWEMPEFDAKTRVELKKQLFLDQETRLCFAHRPYVSECDDNLRVPVRMASTLRQVIVSQRRRLERPLAVLEELALLNTIDSIMNGYYDIRRFMTTPFPFPLVQMSRTFLFFYLFTVPFALLGDVSKPVAHVVVVFFLTYGFMGVETVSIELDNPFGSDSNDFNNLRMAQVSFEDAYMTILDMDGEEWTDKLRRKMDAGQHAGPVPVEVERWLYGSEEA